MIPAAPVVVSRHRAGRWRLFATGGVLLAIVSAMTVTRVVSSDLRPSFRDLGSADQLEVGTAVQASVLGADKGYARLLAQQYGIVTPENEMKWAVVHPAPRAYDFGPADEIVDFARGHGMLVRGHNLVWYLANPAWLVHGRFTQL